jgi:hypothetical protein
VTDNKWISGAVNPANKGGLHRALKVPMGETIPQGRIEKASQSNDLHLAKMANFAKTMKKIHARHGGSV